MSITKELREAIRHYENIELCVAVDEGTLFDIANRIDAEHEKELAGVWDSVGDEGVMAENGWVRLPKDADGKVIHIGDVVDTEHFGTVEVEGFVHSAVAFYNYSGQPAYICTAPANMCRHHHKPTVEDVLLDACKAYHSLMIESMNDIAHDMPAPSQVIAEYADRIKEALRDA